MSLEQDVASYLSYLQGSGIPQETVSLALQYKVSAASVTGGAIAPVYAVANYSGIILAANTAQDLALVNVNRDRLTIQNLDTTDLLLIGIGENAVSGMAYEIDPRGSITIETGEADKRISVISAKAGLRFTAIGVVRS